jgi:hypothetical protein
MDGTNLPLTTSDHRARREAARLRLFTLLMIIVLLDVARQISRRRSRPTAASNVATNGTLAQEGILQEPARSSTSGA